MITGYSPSSHGDNELLGLQELYTDPFTGLDNLFACLTGLTRQFELEGDAEQPVVGLALVDVDRLAMLNDQSGRTAGDEALLLVKTTLLDVVGLQSHIYRFSGDEFAIIKRLHGIDQACQLGNKVISTYRNRAGELFGPGAAPSVSVGMALANLSLASPGALVSRASGALHAAKQKGHGRLEVVHVKANDVNSHESSLLDLFTRRILDTLNIVADVGKLALTDPLTELPNQRAAEHYLKQACKPGAVPNSTTSILLIDGDRLREYNNRYGYSRGNQMIRDLASLLMRSKRKEDFLARWFMGDEFLLVLPQTGPEDGAAVAERLRQAVEAETDAWPLPITVSAGVATHPNDGLTVDELTHAVQEACSRAKRAGKNRVVTAAQVATTPDNPTRRL